MSDKVNTFEEASRQTREDLLQAGLRLLLRLPASAAFGHLTAARIASEAGRTSGAFFHQWPTTEAYLDDFIAYVLRPELAVNLAQTTSEIIDGIHRGLTFTQALTEAGKGVPRQTAEDPQTIIEILMWNRALRDEAFRSRVSGHYSALDAGAAPTFENFMTMLGRTTRPPFTPKVIGAIVTAVAEGLALRAVLSPGFYPDELFGWIIATLVPLLTREPGDKRDATGFAADLPLNLRPGDHSLARA